MTDQQPQPASQPDQAQAGDIAPEQQPQPTAEQTAAEQQDVPTEPEPLPEVVQGHYDPDYDEAVAQADKEKIGPDQRYWPPLTEEQQAEVDAQATTETTEPPAAS